MVRANPPRSIETVVIGAGQAGLSMSSLLGQAGREHVVLDRRDRLGGGWLDRWDAFRLVSPNWTASFPGFAYDGADPDGFMARDEIAGRVARYAEVIGAPVVLGTAVERLERGSAGERRFRLTTSAGPLDADRVVVATGGFQVPKRPPVSSGVRDGVTQLHSHDYRNEGALPSGAVLLIGSGQSGVQIAEELHHAGRRVYLSVGRCGRVPRRYRGRDFFQWLWSVRTHGPDLGVTLPTLASLPDPRLRFACNPQLSGHGGGHDVDLRRFAEQGMTLVGRFEGFDGGRVHFAADLGANLAFADRLFDERFRPIFDTYVERSGEDAPPDDRAAPSAFEPPEVTELDLATAGISTVIWTSGYRLDYGWIDFPILEPDGVPRQVDGLTDVPGLGFIGLPWMRDQASATLFGVGHDAVRLAERLEATGAPAHR
jgi:putative flavoprotein involved in K+ transport